MDILWLVCCIIDESTRLRTGETLPNQLYHLLEWWKSPEAFPGPGCVDVKLEEFLRNEESLIVLRRLVDSVEVSLRGFGSTVPGGFLNRVSNRATYRFEDQNTAHLLSVISQFRGLIDEMGS